MAKMTYKPAPAVQKIAEELIPKYHNHLELEGVEIKYLFREEPLYKNNKMILGQARKISGISAYLSKEAKIESDMNEGLSFEHKPPSPFFVILISEGNYYLLNAQQRIALIDHELCHCWAEMDAIVHLHISILEHDLNEFNAVVERHGNWLKDIGKFLKAAQKNQNSFNFEDEDEEFDFAVPATQRIKVGQK